MSIWNKRYNIICLTINLIKSAFMLLGDKNEKINPSFFRVYIHARAGAHRATSAVIGERLFIFFSEFYS